MNTQQDVIVTLHGLGRNRTFMLPTQLYLEKLGYTVVNESYPSKHICIKKTGENLIRPIIHKAAKLGERVHIFAHSMGGLVTRVALAEKKFHPDNLGGVVMFGTPNHGSKLASLLSNFWLTKHIYHNRFGITGKQVLDNSDFIKSLGAIDFPCMSIAGIRTILPGSNYIFKNKNDGLVCTESAKVDGMRKFVTRPTSHLTIAWNKQNIQLATNFIQTL